MLNQFQTLTMALADLNRLEQGKKLYYIFDGYDFCHWFYKNGRLLRGFSNPFHKTIQESWDNFFSLTNGIETCAVMSPFTIIEFLQTISSQVDNDAIHRRIKKSSEIQTLLDFIFNEEKNYSNLPEHQQRIIQSLYAQIIENKRALELFSKPGPFAQLTELFSTSKIRFFDPMIPDAAQVVELLEYDQIKTDNAISYLREKRKARSSFGEIYDSIDVYHYILIENSRRALSATSVIPYLTSSGILSRNSWYMLKYDSLPNLTNTTIPSDWCVRTIEAPTIVLSTLALFNDPVDNPKNTKAFLEDARSLARIIKQDLLQVPEIQMNLSLRGEDRKKYYTENPSVKVSSNTIELMRRFTSNYRLTKTLEDQKPTKNDVLDTPISIDQITELQEYINNPNKYELQKKTARENIHESIQSLDLPYYDLQNYIAPLGDEAFDMLDLIDKNFKLEN